MIATAMALSCPLKAFAGVWDPFSLLVGATVTRDDNVFRAPAALTSPVADTTKTRYVGLIFDTDQSQQHLHFEAFGNDTSYEKLSYLNNTGSRYQAAWQGLLVQKLKVDANWSRVQSLAGFADFRSTIKNVQTTESSTLRLRYPITPYWSAVASTADGSSTSSASINAVSDSRTRSAEVGAQYDSPLGNQLGLVARNSTGHYPNRQLVPGFSLVDNSYQQQDIEGSLGWVPTGMSRFDVHVAQTRRDHNDVPQRNFIGMTGNVTWDWTPSAKSGLNAYLRRELGAAEYQQANYAVVNVIGVAPRWTPTAKIALQGTVERRKRTFGGDPQFVAAATPVPGDILNSASLTAQYAATSAVQLSLTARHEKRDSTDPTLPYVSNVVSVSAQLMF